MSKEVGKKTGDKHTFSEWAIEFAYRFTALIENQVRAFTAVKAKF